MRTIARLVNQLRFALTPAGAADWLTWELDELDGQRPLDLVDDPRRLPELLALAGSLRATVAT